jgi:hypothetical protein
VRELTGWNAQYVAKLRKAGVLRTHQVTERGWPWYERSQVMEILNGENK